MENFHKLDMADEWVNSAYDENGNAVVCSKCGAELKWHPVKHIYYCRICKEEIPRTTYFIMIGANPPGPECLINCKENYPFCKKYCDYFQIDPHDPMLT